MKWVVLSWSHATVQTLVSSSPVTEVLGRHSGATTRTIGCEIDVWLKAIEASPFYSVCIEGSEGQSQFGWNSLNALACKEV